MTTRLALALLTLALALMPARAEERIERFVSDVQIERNGDLLVVETIQIRAEGRQIKRGILRDFPTTYRRADGSRVEVGFEVQDVTRDGGSEEFSTERMANGVRVRIGSAGRSVNTGSHTYVIRYRTTRQILFSDGYDELYWNVTGNGWTFPIDVAEARIHLPDKMEFKQRAFYTGSQGARGKDAVIVEDRPGLIVFRTTKPLPVANGLTVAAAFPKGEVTEPTSMQKLEAMLKDDPALLTATAGGGAVILYYLLAWLLIGRDPRRGTIIPLFCPPQGMSAAAVRFVDQMNFDDRVFSAAIVGLGVNGRLRLVDRASDKELRHLNKSGKPIDMAEQAVESTLFANRAKVSLDNSEHELIAAARHALHQTLRRAYSGTLFRNHFWWSCSGLAASVVTVAAIALSYADSYGSNAPWILVGMLAPILPVMVGVGMMRKGAHQGGHGGRKRSIIGLTVVAISAAIAIVILATNIGIGPAILPALVPSVLAGFVSRGFSWLQAPSREGRKVMDQIDGFKLYLGTAEEDRLEFLNPPDKTPELFERFLPYAIALDVENTWAKRFTGVLAAAGVGAAVSSWYTGDNHSTGDIGSFADRLGSNLSQTIASASSPPGSTGGGGSDSGGGSSGGGSSGGGGGGGGGSGW
jgi:uncharacterized membrane protein YgcG